MSQVKKKTLVPLIVFLLGICLASLIVYKTDTHEKEQRHITAQLNATTYGERIKNEITTGIEITDTLKQVLISVDGEIHHFDTIAGNLMSDSIESVQLAPNGVVTDIYPADRNEAGKIDLIHDKDRGKISCYARDNHTIITQGPFELKQGGYGIAVRNPVYLKDKNGQEYFWGFTIVILRVPDIFSDAISALSNFGYKYRISKTEAPWSDTYKVVYQSDGQISHPVSYTFTIGDENWKFEVTPKSGWRNNSLLIIVIGLEFAGTIPCFQSSLSGSNLSFFCQNHRKDSICRLQLKCLSGKFSHMHCIFQFRGTRLYNNLCIFIYQLPFKVHIFYGHTDKIRKNQKICLPAGCHCPLVFQSITISCIDGCHLNSGHRIHAKADSFSHVMVNMPFPLDILNMLVICAKAESVTIHVSLYQTAHKCLKISGSTAFPYENGKAVPPFSHCIIKEAALMVRSNPCHGICL